jgi:hypothetical protein
MKYWNKDKKVRQSHWYKVSMKDRQGWNYHTIKRELQLTHSSGKFYLYYGSTAIWFEREQDAMWWILKS